MLEKHRRVLVLALILFLVAGGVDIYVLYAQVIPQILEADARAQEDPAAVPLAKERVAGGDAARAKASSKATPSVRIPVAAESGGERPQGDGVGAAASGETDTEAAPAQDTTGRGVPEASATVSEAPGEGDARPAPVEAKTDDETRDEIPASETASQHHRMATAKSLPGFEALRFGPNKTLLWRFEKKTLRAVAKLVKRYANVSVLLVGHADSAETDPLALSQARADVAKAFLIEQGVSPLRVETEAKGDSKPVTKATEEQERKRNRRVRVRLLLKDEL